MTNSIKLLIAFLISSTLLIGCGQQAGNQPSDTTQPPEATESPDDGGTAPETETETPETETPQ